VEDRCSLGAASLPFVMGAALAAVMPRCCSSFAMPRISPPLSDATNALQQMGHRMRGDGLRGCMAGIPLAGYSQGDALSSLTFHPTSPCM